MLVADGKLEEERPLVGEVVEDRATGEADLLLEPRNRGALVAVAGEGPAGALQDLLPAGLEMLFGDLRHGLTLQNRTYVLLSSTMIMLRNRNLAAVLVAELVSLTGSAMTFVALPWFVLITTGSTAKMGWVFAAELLPGRTARHPAPAP